MGGVSWSGDGGLVVLRWRESRDTQNAIFGRICGAKNALTFKILMHCRRSKTFYFAFMKVICKRIFAPQARPKIA